MMTISNENKVTPAERTPHASHIHNMANSDKPNMADVFIIAKIQKKHDM